MNRLLTLVLTGAMALSLTACERHEKKPEAPAPAAPAQAQQQPAAEQNVQAQE